MSSYSTTLNGAFNWEREELLERFTGLPRIFPVGAIFENEALWGFKLYNLDTKEMSINSIGSILDMILSGTTVAGICIREKYDYDIGVIGSEISGLLNIQLELDTDFYDYTRMSTVNKEGNTEFEFGGGTVIGVNEDTKQLVAIKPNGEIYNVKNENILRDCLIGVSIAKSRVSIQSYSLTNINEKR